MKKAPIPYNEEDRQGALNTYRVLDSKPEKEFDNITHLAAQVAGTKIALISLVDGDRQWFKSKYGLDADETPRDISYCGHAINQDEIFIIEDASKDDRFFDNPLCVGAPNVIFYAGVPLKNAQGLKIGTLCVIDDKPKKLDQAQIDSLETLAEQVIHLLELRLKEIQYVEVADAGNIGHWYFDLSSQSIHWSDKMFDVFFCDKKEGTPSFEKFQALIHKDDWPELEAAIQLAITKAQSYTIQHRVKNNLNQWVWVEGHGDAVLDSKGNVTGINGVCQDIDERMQKTKKLAQAQEELKESNTYLKLALDGAGLGVWDWYLEDNSVKFDKNWATMLGLDVNRIDMKLDTWESRVHPDDLEKCYADIKNYMEGKTPYYENVHRMQHADGYWVYILDRGRFSDWDSEGNPIRFTGTHLDITERMEQSKKLEIANRESKIINDLLKLDKNHTMTLNEKLSEGLDNILNIPWLDIQKKAGIFLTGEDQKLHLKVSHKLGEKIESLCASVECGKCLCGRAMEKKEVIFASCIDERHEVTFDGISPHGHYNVPILSRDNKVLGVMVFYLPHGHKYNKVESDFLNSCAKVMAQIIQTHNYEMDLIAKRDEALEGQKAKSEFLANMSHEIRTPMNGLLGMLDMLSEEDLSETQKDYLNTAMNSGNHLLSIINDILDLSKIESGKLKLEKIEFNLHDMLQGIVNSNSFNAKKKNNKIKFLNLGQAPLHVIGDSVRVRQILDNYLTNALKFSENSDVEIGYEILNDSPVNYEFKLFVKDYGIGISKTDLQKLFQSFSQADASITRKFGGTGLGLSICKRLANLMGGDVYVKSECGKGSEFGLHIKLNRGLNLAKYCFRSKIRNDEVDKSLKILVAEDNGVNQKLIRLMLEKQGLQCDMANDGEEALQLIEKSNNSYDMVFMDIQMPIMDGVTATEKLKEKYGEKAPVIIAQTANAFSEDREKYLKAGMDEFIAKPIKKKELVNVLLKYSFRKNKAA